MFQFRKLYKVAITQYVFSVGLPAEQYCEVCSAARQVSAAGKEQTKAKEEQAKSKKSGVKAANPATIL